MQNPSEEQQHIIDEIKKGKNVMVDACAGSGKSTTILSLAMQCPDISIIQITYNSMLRLEIKEKIKELHIKNIEVHTYHSLAVKYYLPSAHNDMEMRRIFIENINPMQKIPLFQIIVIDEAQDMTPLYFKLIRRFIADLQDPIQLLILGDYMQGLYEFKGSDIRYLTKAREIWQGYSQLKTQEFAECTLKTSYRITNQMADFVNQTMLGEKRLYACKEGAKVAYIRGRKHNIYRTVVYEIAQLMKEGAQPSDFFILGASVKGQNNQIRKIENMLVEAGIPCHVPTIETDKIDDKVISKKAVFSTFHSVKGRQRKHVFVMGFDNTYMKFHGRTYDPNKCPNTLYVATTRATERLYVFERDQDTCDRPLSFLKMSHHEMKTKDFIEFRGQAQTIFYDRSTKGPEENTIRHHVTPTELVHFIPDSVLIEIIPILLEIFIKETENTPMIDIPTTIQTKQGYHEDVSDLNGIAIPAMFYDYIESQYSSQNKPPPNILYDIIQMGMANVREGEHMFLKQKIRDAKPICEEIGDYLYMANLYIAVQEKLYFKLQQIDTYDWLSDDILGKCKTRLLDILGKECDNGDKKPLIEETMIHYMDDEDHAQIDETLEPHFQNRKFRFSARTDIITYRTLWEIKCTSDITHEHMIQTIIYAWIWRMTKTSPINVKIFNIKSGEIYRLDATTDQLTNIMVLLLKGKYDDRVEMPDTDFVVNNRQI